MADNFKSRQRRLESPGDRHAAVVLINTLPLNPRPRALWCQVDGDLVIEDRDGTVLTYTLVASQVVPFRAVMVRATGTTVTVYGWD